MGLPVSVTRKFARSILVAKKNSPTIFFAGGVAGVIGSTVLACKATLSLNDILDEIRAEVEEVKFYHINLANDNVVDLDEAESSFNRDISMVWARGALKITKRYAPAIVVGSISIGALTGSHIALTKRNAALAAAYATVVKAYDEYRERVREEIGEDRESHIYQNVEVCEIESEDGKKANVLAIGEGGGSPYSKIFSPQNPRWQDVPEYNRMFLEMQQTLLNKKLHANKHVLLNDAYEALGFPRTSAGMVVGWLLNGDGDGHVDFGLYTNSENVEFMLGNEECVLLDFNVDGVIYDKI